MTRLLITRGLPAAGKTTFARKLQPRVARVNRDDLRRMLHGARLFTRFGAGFEVHDFADVPLAECIRRDAARPEAEQVGASSIRAMHDRCRWRIVGVFDDRQQVVRMWRALGLTVFQVAEGDF
ncbi:phosphatase domain-containing protein [Paractinoplanes rishiriensis]|uniref:phosphatase domain-containing protein n=1 Tax=Paractinoplanes rishiriensis TaxID=1050105 RepID=UPI0019427BAE|nr:AAA family ATPase [Actinoplanes rishiriensis]